MSAGKRSACRRVLAALIFFLLPPRGAGAEWGAGVEEPRWFRFRLDETYARLSVEDQREKRTTAGSATRRDYTTVEPTLGVGAGGSFYHPNLLSFDLAAEAGPSWQRSAQDPPGGTSEGTRSLHRYHAGIDILRAKPYSTGLFADRNVTYHDFDFFNRVRVDSLRHGGRTGYGAGPIPFRLGYDRLEEDTSGLRNGNSSNDQETFTFRADNARGKSGRTEVSCLRDRYLREQESAPAVSGIQQSASLIDTETWGRGDRATLRSMAFYNRQSETAVPMRSLTILETLDLAHSPNLSSRYRYSYSPSESGSVDSEAQDGGAQLRHQLYQSLTSVVEVRGSRQRSDSPASSFRSERHGAGWEESYTKRLPGKGRLSLGGSVRFDRERRESSGRLLSVANEPHRIADGTPEFLNYPDVAAVSLVTDPSGIPYAEILDYIVVPQGALTEIRRVPGGRIPDGGTVHVSYAAAAPPSDAYTTWGRSAQVRLDLLDRTAGFYGRLSRVTNRGGESLVLQELSDRVAGVEFTRRWLHAGAEYENYRSNLSPFRAVRLFQSVSFAPTAASTLTLDFSQSRTSFPDTGLTRRSSSSIGRYRARLAPPLLLSMEGGLRFERGEGVAQDLKTARASLDFAYAQLTASAGYEYLEDEYQGELHVKKRFFLNLRRSF